MKIYILIFAFIMANGCKTTSDKQDGGDAKPEIRDVVVTLDDCPEGVECDVMIKRNSTMTLKEDTIGMLYPTVEAGDNMVVQFTYMKKGPEGTADGDYSETLHFEVPYDTKELSLANEELQNVSLLFGKHCFCRGEAGYYKVVKGNLTLTKTAKEVTFDIKYLVDKTSQEMNHLSKTIQL